MRNLIIKFLDMLYCAAPVEDKWWESYECELYEFMDEFYMIGDFWKKYDIRPSVHNVYEMLMYLEYYHMEIFDYHGTSSVPKRCLDIAKEIRDEIIEELENC